MLCVCPPESPSEHLEEVAGWGGGERNRERMKGGEQKRASKGVRKDGRVGNCLPGPQR